MAGFDPSIIFAAGQSAPAASGGFNMGQMLQLMQMRDEQQSRRLQIQAMERKQADEIAFRQALPKYAKADGVVDWHGLMGDLSQQGRPELVMGLQSFIDKTLKEQYDAQKAKTDANVAALTMGGRLLRGVLADGTQASYDGALKYMREGLNISPDLLAQLGPTFDPKRIQQGIAWSMSATEANQAMMTAFDQALKLRQEAHTVAKDTPKMLEEARALVGNSLRLAKNKEGWDGAKGLLALSLSNVPGGATLLEQIGEWSPDAPQRAAQFAMTAKESADVTNQDKLRTIQQGQLDVSRGQLQVARQNAQTSAANAQTNAERLKLDREKFKETMMTPEGVAGVADMAIKGVIDIKNLPANDRRKVLQEIATNKSGTIATDRQRAMKQTALDALQTIDTLRKHPGYAGAVGFKGLVGTFTGPIPGTPEADFGPKVQELVSQLALPQYELLRGTGAISDAEGELLRRSKTSLNTEAPETQFADELDKIEDALYRSLHRMDDKLPAEYRGGFTEPTVPMIRKADGKTAMVPRSYVSEMLRSGQYRRGTTTSRPTLPVK